MKQISTEQACIILHNAYEATAKHTGWETNKSSQVPWSQVPEKNKATMRAAVKVLMNYINK